MSSGNPFNGRFISAPASSASSDRRLMVVWLFWYCYRSQSFRHASPLHATTSGVGTSLSVHPLLPVGDNVIGNWSKHYELKNWESSSHHLTAKPHLNFSGQRHSVVQIGSRCVRIARQEHIDSRTNGNGRCSPFAGTAIDEWTSGRWYGERDGCGIAHHFQQLGRFFQPPASALSLPSAADAIRSLPLVATDGRIFFSAPVALSRSDP